MAAHTTKPELLVLVGPTASGKSALALKIAAAIDGEIIAVDSRTIFKGLDIGTAKPSPEDRSAIPHWGLDLIEPGQTYSAAEFKGYAEQKIAEIRNRGRMPILVGGTGLYIDSVLFNFTFGPKADSKQRQELEGLNLKELKNLIRQNDLPVPANDQNKRHLIRALELAGYQPSANISPRLDSMIIGLLPDDERLRRRIHKRAGLMFKMGVIGEAEKLFRDYPEVDPRSVGIVYKLIADMKSKALNEEEAIQIYERMEWQYARRQRTWFRRNKFIQWFNNADDAEQFILKTLNT